MWAGAAVWAQMGGDLQAQILYAWQSGDMNRLQAIRHDLQQVAQGAGAPTSARYHLAHANYRIALLRISLHQAGPEKPLQECIHELAALLRSDPASAEAMILQAACQVQMASLRRLQSAYMRRRATHQLDLAEHLSPGNPRAALVRAELWLQESGAADPDPGPLTIVARLFDGSAATNPDAPGWGHAEAYLMLGHALRLRGDRLGARNWIEKALIVAPDYKAARMELALISH